MTYIINNFGLEIIGLLLCAIFAWMGRTARMIWKDKIDTDTKRVIAYQVFQFVEQVWQELKGEAKMQKALETARELLEKKGIDWDAEEMRVLIEVCVAEFNRAFKAPLLNESTHDAVYRDDEPQDEQSMETDK